jgi:hypothetical protein
VTRILSEMRLEVARQCVTALIQEYGGVKAAGRAYDERFGLRPLSGERLLGRVHAGSQDVRNSTLDRLTTMAGRPEAYVEEDDLASSN